MTPAARTAAAIELLTEIERTGKPVDVAAKGFFRRRRYAGSGDRRFIIGLVYDSFRQRGQAFHEISEAGLEPTDRRLILMALKGAVEDLDRHFDGSQYGPEALDDDERALIAAEPDEEVGGIWPAWMQASIVQRFGDDASAEMLAMNERASTVIRANTMVGSPAKLLARLPESRPGRFASAAIVLGHNATAKDTAELRPASFEIQDEGSQIAALLVGAEPGHQVIDYCAGGGGKTLALAATMQNKGQIYAFDVNEARLKEVLIRVKVAKVHNVQAELLGAQSQPLLDELKEKADRVLVDAPCTGSGTWRRHPEGKWLIKESDVQKAASLQADILARASALVAGGGRLIYVTCSFFQEENEDVVADFLAEHKDFTLRDAAPLWQETVGSEMPEGISAGPDGQCISLSPLRAGTDAFYIAIMERNKG